MIVNRHEHISNIDGVNMNKAITIQIPSMVSEKDWQSAHYFKEKGIKVVRSISGGPFTDENALVTIRLFCGGKEAK